MNLSLSKNRRRLSIRLLLFVFLSKYVTSFFFLGEPYLCISKLVLLILKSLSQLKWGHHLNFEQLNYLGGFAKTDVLLILFNSQSPRCRSSIAILRYDTYLVIINLYYGKQLRSIVFQMYISGVLTVNKISFCRLNSLASSVSPRA